MAKDERLTIFGSVLMDKFRFVTQTGIVHVSVALLGLLALFEPACGQVVDNAREVATDPRAAVADRVRALRNLAQDHSNSLADVREFSGLLAFRTPLEVQLAVVDLLASRPGEQVTELLLSNWTNHGPRVHTAVLSYLLWREPWVGTLDRRAESRPDLAASLTWARRDITQRHRSAAVRIRAQRLLDEIRVQPEIQLALDRFLSCLELKGNAGRGRRLFEETTCSNCHRLDGVGRQITLDLSRLTDKSPRSLLVHTIDPNRLVEHRCMEYTVVTDDGLQIAGMMLDESTDSITFADTEGKEHLVERKEIDEIACNARSHMPEGLAAKLTLQQMADLLAFMTAAMPESPGRRPWRTEREAWPYGRAWSRPWEEELWAVSSLP